MPGLFRPERVLGVHERGSGPTLVIVGGVHGNEPAGLMAAERVLRQLSRETPDAFRGRLVAVRGNLGALIAATADEPPRYLDADLNRMFVAETIAAVRAAPAGDLSGERAELRELVDLFDDLSASSTGGMCVLDLHTVSADSPPFIAVEDALPARRFAQRFGVPMVLGVEEELRGLLMDYITNELGHVAMVLEGGRHDDPAASLIHEAAIWVALDEAGVLALDAVPHSAPPLGVLRSASGGRAGHVYDVRYRRAILDASYRGRPRPDAFEWVRAGATIIADEAGAPVTPEVSGLLFMPNRQRHPRVGDDGFFVVRSVGRIWLTLSAWLRGVGWLHAGVPMLLPGVRTGSVPGELYVSADIASVATREVFHLLGYRIVRRPNERYLSKLGRLLMGVRALFRAVVRAVRHAASPSSGHPASVGPRPREWIVRRRVLDTRGDGA